jgi:hypothetical protein
VSHTQKETPGRKASALVIYKKPSFVITAIACSLVFSALFAFRLDLFSRFQSNQRLSKAESLSSLADKDSWMRIYQADRPVGYAHRSVSKQTEGNGFIVAETVFMRINTMGLIQDIHLQTEGRLSANFTLKSFEFTIKSGRLSFSASGMVAGNILSVETSGSDPGRKFEIPLNNKPYLIAGMIDAVQAIGLKPGEFLTVDVFDPVTMGQVPVKISIVGAESIPIGGINRPTTKVMLQFQGVNQFAWIGENGEVVREKGLLGIRLEKSSRQAALATVDSVGSEDMARLAAVAVDATINDPMTIKKLTLKIGGIDTGRLHLNGERQRLVGDVLTVNRETLSGLPPVFKEGEPGAFEQTFLKPTPFIGSDHPKIRNLAKSLVEKSDATLLGRAKTILDWVHANLEKRPVFSLPDALTTLESGAGDCNEHAVLVAALARAVGIPARIETGLVYLEGRFYYHAWNILYLGRWITVDAVYKQLPADVTHIRLATGIQQQVDLISTIGGLNITVLQADAVSGTN